MKTIYIIYKSKEGRKHACLYSTPMGTATKADAVKWFKITHPFALVISSTVSTK